VYVWNRFCKASCDASSASFSSETSASLSYRRAVVAVRREASLTSHALQCHHHRTRPHRSSSSWRSRRRRSRRRNMTRTATKIFKDL